MAIRQARILASLAAALLFALVAIGLFYAYNPAPGGGADGDAVAVLAWRRGVLAGEEVSPADVRRIELPPAVAADLPDVARAGEEQLLKGTRLRKGVRKHDFVRRSELEAAAAPASRPERLVEVDPGELTPMGDGRFLSTTRTAVGGRFDDASVVIRSAAGPTPPPLPTSGPMEGLGAAGLAKIDGEVEGAVRPGGAKRLYAFRRKIFDGLTDTAAYVVPLGLSDAENFYKTQLPKTGYKLIRRSKALRPGGVALVFDRGRQHYCFVNLHPTDKDTETRVVLVISRPGK